MANENGVKIGNIKRMGGGTTPPPPVDELPPWSERETGLPGFLSAIDKNRTDAIKREQARTQQGWNWLAGTPAEEGLDPAYLTSRRPSGAGGERMARELAGYQPAEVAPTEIIGGSGGGGVAGPDYSAYRASLTDQAQQINAQIQAMYNQLGESAGENVSRIEDIYGGAQTGIGDIYGSASANTADAYGSSQQQAADQLARLGIEAAAPAVVNPMALSQAEALSGLEAGKAGGQAALERYGASAGGFGSQMAQVAQQQGTEMNSAVLAALQGRLNDSLLMEEQGRQAAAQAAAAGAQEPEGLSFRDQLAERQFAFDVAQAAAKPANEYAQWQANKFYELTTPSRDRPQPLYTPEEAIDYLNGINSQYGPGR
jgi:hypothetical protein